MDKKETANDYKDIMDKFKGISVKVYSKKWNDEKIAESCYSVLDIILGLGDSGLVPFPVCLEVSPLPGKSDMVPFIGYDEGIFKITDLDNRVLYQNDSVLKDYKTEELKSRVKQAEIRDKGKFFL